MHVSTFSSARLIGAAAMACGAVLPPVAAFATVASPAPPARAAAAASTPRCTTSGLVVRLDTQGNGAAGTIYYNLKFTNPSRRACTLRGYPGVSAVNDAGHQLGRAASRDTSHKPRLVRLSGGATATAVLGIVVAANFPRSICRQVTASGLRVYPPNQAASKVLRFRFPACSRRGPAYLFVRPVQKA